MEIHSKTLYFDKISKCSHCGKDLHFKLYPIFNLQNLNEEEFNDLFELKLFKVECEHCKKTTVVQYDTIVVDMFKKYIVYVYTSDDVHSFKETTSEIIDKIFKSTANSAEAFKEIKNFRIVTNLNDMLEKMLIFDYDLDDRIIECVKYQAIKTYLDKTSKLSYKLYFNKIDKTDLIFTAIQNESTKNSPIILSAPLECYNFFIDNTNIKSLDNSEFTLINTEWMLKNVKIEIEMKNV